MAAPNLRVARRALVVLMGLLVGVVLLATGGPTDALPVSFQSAAPSGSGGSSSGTSGSSAGSYVVRSGDTVAAISRRTGVAADDLRAANGIVGDRLYAGARLVLRPGAARGSTGTGSSVVRGPRIVCPVPGASFMNDWGFPRDGGSRFHEGTDLFAPRGTPIAAPITGQLTFATNRLGGRTFTIVSPSGWVAYGAHLGSTVGGSRWVAAGTTIGAVGDSGNAKGGDTHLHLGLKLGWSGRPVNPYPSVSAAC